MTDTKENQACQLGFTASRSIPRAVESSARHDWANFNRQHRRSFQTSVEAQQHINARALVSSQNWDEIQILEDFIGSLGELDRDIFLMYVDGLSYREISDVVALDEAHLRVQVSRLKRSLPKGISQPDYGI